MSDNHQEPEFRLLVCGGRDFTDAQWLRIEMNAAVGARRNVVVIHGAARGADRLAGELAKPSGISVLEFPANWDRDGRAAGPIRNQRMLDEGRPHLVLAAPGGVGTADMVRRARKAGIPVIDMAAK